MNKKSWLSLVGMIALLFVLIPITVMGLTKIVRTAVPEKQPIFEGNYSQVYRFENEDGVFYLAEKYDSISIIKVK